MQNGALPASRRVVALQFEPGVGFAQAVAGHGSLPVRRRPLRQFFLPRNVSKARWLRAA